MSAYRQVKIQELAQSELYQLRYSREGKLVLPLSPAAEDLEETRRLTLTEKAKIRHAHYCLKIAEPEPDAERLELVGHYLEAFDLLCELEEWEEAWEVLAIRLDTPTEEQLHNQLGTWGCYDEQVQLYERLLGKLCLCSNGVCLNGLGGAYHSLGEHRKAIEFHQQCLSIEREIGDRRGEASSLGNLGNPYHFLGEYRKAIDYYQQGLTISQEISHREWEASSLGNLGAAYQSLGEYRKAIEFQEQSLTIRREIGNRDGEASSLGNLGAAYQSLGEYRKAIEFQEQSLTIRREIGDRRGEASSLGSLGIAYQSLGEYRKAIEFHQQSLTIEREIGDRRGEASSLGNLGAAYQSLGEHRKAIELHQQSLTIRREIGYRRGEANSLYNLSLAYHKLGRVKEGFAAAYRAGNIMQELDLTVDAMSYPQWIKSSVKFARRGRLQLALCWVLGVVAFPFALVWSLVSILWLVVSGSFRRVGG